MHGWSVRLLAAGSRQGPRASSSLTHRAALNALAALLDYGSTLLVGLLVTPALLHSLDSATFGVWQMLKQLVSYLATADGRPSQALKWVIAHEQASADAAAKRRLVGSAVAIWLLFLPVLSMVGAVLVWVAPMLAKAAPADYPLVRLATALLVANFVLGGLLALPAAVLRGENQGYQRMGLAAGLTLLGGALTVAAVQLGFGLVGVAAAQVLASLLTAVLFTLVVARRLAWFGLAWPTRAEVRRFLAFNTWFFGSVLVSRLLSATDVMLLGVLTSPATVTLFTVTEFAAVTLSGLFAASIGAMLPGLGAVLGRGQRATVAALRGELLAGIWLLVTIVGTPTLLLNRSFVALWVGPDHYAGPVANLLLVVLVAQAVFIRTEGALIDLGLQLARKTLLGLVAALLSLVLAAALIPRLGIVGLCLGLLLGRALLSVGLPMLVCSFLGQRTRPAPRALLRHGMVTAVLFGSAAWLSEQVLLTSWPIWAGLSMGTLILATAAAYRLGLTATQRAQLRLRLGLLLVSLPLVPEAWRRLGRGEPGAGPRTLRA